MSAGVFMSRKAGLLPLGSDCGKPRISQRTFPKKKKTMKFSKKGIEKIARLMNRANIFHTPYCDAQRAANAKKRENWKCWW